MTWNPITAPVDYIVLAGSRSPGIAEIEGAESLRAFVVRQPPFSTGALIVHKRRELAEFTVRIRLYTLEDHAAWNAWRPIVDTAPDAFKSAKGLDIQHPLLDPLGITAVVVKSVGQLMQTADGEWTVAIKFLEWRGLPKPSLAKVEGSKAEPVDPVEETILNNSAKIDRLARDLAGPTPLPEAQ